MILDDIKSLIKDFETCLIKEERFKKDYKFKSQVKTIYSCNESAPNQIIVPVPYYSGNNGNTCTNTDNSTKGINTSRTEVTTVSVGKDTPPSYSEGKLRDFEREEEELRKLGKRFDNLKGYSPEELVTIGRQKAASVREEVEAFFKEQAERVGKSYKIGTKLRVDKRTDKIIGESEDGKKWILKNGSHIKKNEIDSIWNIDDRP